MFFSDQTTRLWFTFYFPGHPRSPVLCGSSVIYFLWLLALILLSPHSIFLAFITPLLMLFPAFIGRNSGVWPPRHSPTQFQSLISLGALDPSSLEAQCQGFLAQGLALSKHSSYRSGQRKFSEFCSQLGKLHQSGSPCPADEWTLCLFATFLASSVQHSTIEVYLSAVRAMHIEQGFSDPLVDCLW